MIDTREELILGLREASQLEHGLMVQYLYAAMTLKRSVEDGLSAAQIDLVRSWRTSILLVAHQEMAHLGTVQNVLAAIGGASHFDLPRLPILARYYHPPQVFSLEPLTPETIARFVQFEAPIPLEKTLQPDTLEYLTVGDLYRQIQVGLGAIAEDKLFIGPLLGQDDADWSVDVHIFPTRTLKEARTAINQIIEEGEATTSGGPDSHYERFLTIQRAYQQEVQHDPEFVPYLDVASNPTTIIPNDGNSAYIDEPSTRQLAELFNSCYLTLLVALGQCYKFQEVPDVPLQGVDTIRELRTLCVGLMKSVLRPLGQQVLPDARMGATGKRAGPCFETYGAPDIPWHRRVVWQVLHERLVTERDAAAALQALNPALSDVVSALGDLAGTAKDLIG